MIKKNIRTFYLALLFRVTKGTKLAICWEYLNFISVLLTAYAIKSLKEFNLNYDYISEKQNLQRNFINIFKIPYMVTLNSIALIFLLNPIAIHSLSKN